MPTFRTIYSRLLVLCLLLPACGGAEVKDDDENEELALEITGEGEVHKFDLNGDGAPDVWKTFTTTTAGDKSSRLLGRAELDVNFDGQVDITQFFAATGAMVRESMDMDFDGKIDAVDHYKDGELIRREVFLNFNETPSIWKFYESNELVRKESDTRGDGKADTFEFFEKGKISKVGFDSNADGRPDRYELPGDDKKRN
ncbi:MAG: hypothetical protein VYE15_00330 [Myxococcota bacterium]|nr:hypothetical protein [Myxococcota bacterium]